MSQPPMRPAAMRGAVDLSGLGQTPQPTPAAGGGGAGKPGTIRVDGTDATFQDLMLGTQEVPAVVVLWSASHPETEKAVTNAVQVAEKLDGRIQVIAVDVQANPGIASAFQAQQIPLSVGLIAAQPVPLFPGVQPVEQLTLVFEELLKVAGQNGVNGRVQVGQAGPAEEPAPMSPEHEAAYDAIERGDFAAAVTAYEQALKLNPKDSDASAGLAQVKLMQRTQGADLQAARAAAAANPEDVDAQLLVADLDLLGGHVEDAFVRVIDIVRATSEDDREKARQHLLSLFEVVGAQDERVVKARRTLMSALF
ncbi:co-chaperone YbbN [Gephyromycinifex aptenodytis]|uniref:co-chaperone YbbN n=1 Tax=Gephyromycinifex aptenodytis TaxID=2716227 RepID=UPI001446A43C|nr:tetratricopeptide repeat protein [Gephyromycinifex aptenodytis]